jgi:hypothetical protein
MTKLESSTENENGIPPIEGNVEDFSPADLEEIFREIDDSDASRSEKRVQRYIVAVEDLINSKYGGCWEKAPWMVQFAPVIVKFFPKFKYAEAVNPGLEGFSGFMGVSKQGIVERLNSQYRPNHVFFKDVPTLENLEQRFEEENGEALTFPIICKPDIGERASGIKYMYSSEQLEEYLQPIDESLSDEAQKKLKDQRAQPNFHLEKFHDDREFALSFTKDPDTGEYQTWSLVEKQIPFVVGDGNTTLRELIVNKVEEMNLASDRKDKIFNCFSQEDLETKLPDGEHKTIVKMASISYGTTFKKIDLKETQMQQLRTLLPLLIEDSKGIYQGRFDLRAKSLEDLLEGLLKIIEKNGLGGMPMEIYESHLSISEKYKILFTYFEYLLQIAERNVENKNAQKVVNAALPVHVGKLLFTKNKTQELTKTDKEKASLRADVKHILKVVLRRGKGMKRDENTVDIF